MEICGIKIQPDFSTFDFDEYTEVLEQQFNIIGFIDGHESKDKIYNPLWIIKEINDIFIIMFCAGKNLFTKLCPEAYQKILDFEKEKNYNKKITWFSQDYIYGKTKDIGLLSIHQVIMNYYRNGYGTGKLSVDHIDRDPYNNTIANLRLATCEEQNQNRKGTLPGTKYERQSNARELPEGVTQEDMPKYVTYNVNIWNKEKNKIRDFFRIERHPLLFPKIWEGTKSMKVQIIQKLEQAKKILQNLDNGILPIKLERNLPKYVYFSIIHDNQTLLYDNRQTGNTKQMKIKDKDFDLNNNEKREKQVYIFNHWIIQSFGEKENILPDDYEYYGEQIDENELNENLFKLPTYVSLYNEKDVSILSFRRIVDSNILNKKMKLPNNYIDFETPSLELLNDIKLTLPKLNKEIIKKYGKEFSVIELSDEIINEIIEEKQEEIINGFPMYSRIQSFSGEEYLVFNKIVDKKRLYTTIKLPHNYNKNKELHEFNIKIIELYGKEHSLDLKQYPYEAVQQIIPENLYIVTTCKSPYIFVINNNSVLTHKLPIRYDLQDQIDLFYTNKNSYSQNLPKLASEYKNIDEEWKPKNISLIQKSGKPTLSYQKRSNDCKHGISILLPNTPFNIELYLLEINIRIVSKYGKEHSIFYIQD
jgi:hypothetical protein